MATQKASKKGAGKKPAKTSTRKEKLIEGVLRGKTPAKAARDAGFSESYARVNVYRELAKTSTQERIQARIREAQIDTNEIIGTLVSHMRGDFADLLPDDKFIQAARANGVSHLLKEVEITERTIPAEIGEDGEVLEPTILERKYKLKIHDAQAAAKHLTGVFGLEKLPAPNPETAKQLDDAVGRFIEKAAAKGLTVTEEQARTKLQPYYETPGVM